MLEPDVVEPDEARAIGEWVRSGGHLVAGGLGEWLGAVLTEAPAWEPTEPGRRRALTPVPGVRQVDSLDGGGWREIGGALPRLGPASAPLLVSVREGRGRVTVLADVSPLQNRGLARADNAALGIALAGGAERPVAFLETVHGYGVARGFGRLAGERPVGADRARADRAGGDLVGRAALRAGGGARGRARSASRGLRRGARRRARAGRTANRRSVVRELHARVAGEVRKVVVGHAEALEDMLAALALGGHVLLEGVPGVAKTLLASATARALGIDFRRLQFTPDMLPSDVTGTMALRSGELVFRPGPVFAGVVLADEINRTPPKTQAALLEAMQEGQVTVDGVRHPLPDPFLVLATQNPVEYEGTYPLPEAQRDRFLVHVAIGYPTEDEERAMLRLARAGPRARGARGRAAGGERRGPAAPRAPRSTRPRSATRSWATSSPSFAAPVSCPRSRWAPRPRAAVHLLGAAKAAARLAGRAYVTPDDVARMAAPVLRHRLVLTPEAELERATASGAIRTALEDVPVPR